MNDMKVLKFITRCLYVLLPIFIFVSAANAANAIRIDEQTSVYPLEGPCLELLEDEYKELAIETVITDKYLKLFELNDQEVINLGYTDSAFWIRFTIENSSREKEDMLLESGEKQPSGYFSPEIAGALPRQTLLIERITEKE